MLLAAALTAWIGLSGAAVKAAAWSEREIFELAGDAGFSVSDILVEGRVHSDPDVLRAIINVRRGDPILSFDPRDARELIERISWVREAHVERRLPGTIYIGLIEREPVALWQNKGKLRLIDADGVTLSDSRLSSFGDLIILVGEKAPDHAAAFLSLLAAEPSVRKKVEAATWIGDRRWDMKLENGILVRLPENDAGLALHRLAEEQRRENLLEKDISVIDLREEGRMIVRTRPGAVHEYKAGTRTTDSKEKTDI